MRFIFCVTINLISWLLVLGQISSSVPAKDDSHKALSRPAITTPSTRPVQNSATQPENSNGVPTHPSNTIKGDELDGSLIGSPFFEALLSCDEKKVWHFINKGIDVKKADKYGFTPLHFAGCPRIAEILLSAGANPNAHTLLGLTPLHYAQGKVGELLIQSGANYKARDANGNTVLHTAAGNGQLETIALMLSKNVPVDIRNDFLETPLYCAINRSQFDAAEMLLKRGADVKAESGVWYTPIFYARTEEIARLLLAKGADPNKVGLFGDRPLHLAVREAPYGVVKLLLQHGASPNVKNYYGKTPIDEARNRNDPRIIELFSKATSQKSGK